MAILKIDGAEVEVSGGASVLDAAAQAGVRIPTMCFVQGLPHFASCMVCSVRNNDTGAFIPSCSARAEDGMDIDATGEQVRQLRKDALELLLSEHIGDCEGPCRQGCPAHMNIPLMLRQLVAGEEKEAAATIRQHLVLPRTLARICHAPCEKVCRRARHDSALTIRDLVRRTVDGCEYTPSCGKATGRKVAVVGAGPAGLSAAWHLRIAGHDCTIYDKQDQPGGALRYDVSRDVLPADILDVEIDEIKAMGVVFEFKASLGKDIELGGLRKQFDAVVLAVGEVGAEDGARYGVGMGSSGIEVSHRDLATSESGVFAGGNAVRHSHMAARAVGDGRLLALSVSRFLEGETGIDVVHRFNSRIGKLKDGEMDMFLAQSGVRADGARPGNVRAEASRCLHCDCRKSESCALREFATEYGASQRAYGGDTRALFEQVKQHAEVIYEPGKCIKCGVCVRITEKMSEPLGLTFVGRGFDVRVGGAFDESLEKSLTVAANECAEKCPTGALALK